jgi:uncharacterized delta-60 repeat protein
VTRFAGVWAMAQGVAVQADGKIVAAGFTGMSHYSLDVVVVRYTTAGTLDTTFGRGGKVVTDFVDDGETASAVAIQRDGRIVVAGRSGLGGCALLRYTNAGLLDRSFGTGGRVVTDLAGNGLAYALAIQRDGKIVVAGQRWVDKSEFAVARFTIDGRLDRTFGSGGGVLTGIRGYDVPDESRPAGRKDRRCRLRRRRRHSRARRFRARPLHTQREARSGLRHGREGRDRPERR